MRKAFVLLLSAIPALTPTALPQTAERRAWNPGSDAARRIFEESGQRLKIGFEFTSRFEARTGVNFGREPHLENPLLRTRVSAEYQPAGWLKVSAMAQDCRAPLYGRPAPTSARDTVDLQEGYLELFPETKLGFGALLGRQTVVFGDGRLIGSPQWSNTARTYDAARLYYRLPAVRLEFLLVSIVKVRPDEFNRPVLGDRVWGMYHSFPGAIQDGSAEVYLLRHDQNRPGGFSETGRLGINTFGGRVAGPLPQAWKYTLELALQNGKVGPRNHRALGWASRASRSFTTAIPVDFSTEYKYASGTQNPEGNRSGTFDQLYPASHDKFGHADLLAWRNIHNIRSLVTLRPTQGTAVNLMYNNSWLASARDAAYNLQGRPIAQSVDGSAGRHIGQELDVFATQRWNGFVFGAGFAHLFAGSFLKNTTPGVNTRYLYVFQSYGF